MKERVFGLMLGVVAMGLGTFLGDFLVEVEMVMGAVCTVPGKGKGVL